MSSKHLMKSATIDKSDTTIIGTNKMPRKSLIKSESKTTRRSQSLDRIYDDNIDSKDERRSRRQFMHLISEKNEQIEKLIKRVTILHSLNNEFAVEHEKLQKDLQQLQKRCATYEQQNEEGCISCRALTKESDQYRSEINRLSQENEQLLNDINMMKILIYRLNVQLENYQEVIRKKDGDGCRFTIDNNLAPTNDHYETVDWGGLNLNVLAPLLNAYQESIKEKTNLIRQYENEISSTTGRIKDIMVENEQFMGEIENLKLENETWSAEKIRLQAQLDVCRSKAEIHSKRADLAKEKLIEVIRCYEQKHQSQSIDMQRLQEAYTRIRSEQTNCKSAHQQPELMVESLKECQKKLGEIQGKHNVEKSKLIEELNNSKELNSKQETEKLNQQHMISEQKSTIDSLNEKIRMFEKKLDKIRCKFHRMQQSRDLLKSRLKSALIWNRKITSETKPTNNISWQDIRKIEQLLIQKEAQLQQLRVMHINEMEKMQRKLNRRDEMLKKILLNKVKSIKKTNSQ